MDQNYSYAEFEYEGSLPIGLIIYLLMPVDSETSLEESQVLIKQPSLDEINRLKSRIKSPFPTLTGDETFSASLNLADDKITETLCIVCDGKQIFSESRETAIDKQNLFHPSDTLFISDT